MGKNVRSAKAKGNGDAANGWPSFRARVEAAASFAEWCAKELREAVLERSTPDPSALRLLEALEALDRERSGLEPDAPAARRRERAEALLSLGRDYVKSGNPVESVAQDLKMREDSRAAMGDAVADVPLEHWIRALKPTLAGRAAPTKAAAQLLGEDRETYRRRRRSK